MMNTISLDGIRRALALASVVGLGLATAGPVQAGEGRRDRTETPREERSGDSLGPAWPEGVPPPEPAGPLRGSDREPRRPGIQPVDPRARTGEREDGPVAIRTDRIRLVGAEPAAPAKVSVATDPIQLVGATPPEPAAPVAISTDPIQLVGATPPEPAAPVAVTTDPIRLEGYEPATTGVESPFSRRNPE